MAGSNHSLNSAAGASPAPVTYPSVSALVKLLNTNSMTDGKAVSAEPPRVVVVQHNKKLEEALKKTENIQVDEMPKLVFKIFLLLTKDRKVLKNAVTTAISQYKSKGFLSKKDPEVIAAAEAFKIILEKACEDGSDVRARELLTHFEAFFDGPGKTKVNSMKAFVMSNLYLHYAVKKAASSSEENFAELYKLMIRSATTVFFTAAEVMQQGMSIVSKFQAMDEQTRAAEFKKAEALFQKAMLIEDTADNAFTIGFAYHQQGYTTNAKDWYFLAFGQKARGEVPTRRCPKASYLLATIYATGFGVHNEPARNEKLAIGYFEQAAPELLEDELALLDAFIASIPSKRAQRTITAVRDKSNFAKIRARLNSTAVATNGVVAPVIAATVPAILPHQTVSSAATDVKASAMDTSPAASMTAPVATSPLPAATPGMLAPSAPTLVSLSAPVVVADVKSAPPAQPNVLLAYQEANGQTVCVVRSAAPGGPSVLHDDTISIRGDGAPQAYGVSSTATVAAGLGIAPQGVDAQELEADVIEKQKAIERDLEESLLVAAMPAPPSRAIVVPAAASAPVSGAASARPAKVLAS